MFHADGCWSGAYRTPWENPAVMNEKKTKANATVARVERRMWSSRLPSGNASQFQAFQLTEKPVP